MMLRWTVLAALTGCALMSRSEPLQLRYFAPPATPAAGASPSPVARLRLGQVNASAHLRAAIEHRSSEIEIAPYETLRWTEFPDAYVRRSLGHALFEARPLERAVGGSAATLEVEILAFEEVAQAGRSTGRVRLRYELRDDHCVLAHGEVIDERPARDPSIEQVVIAIGSALEAATSEVADRVVAQLAPR